MRTRRIVISATAGISQRLLQVAATLIAMPLVLHALGAGRFGLWGAAASLAWMTGLVDLGLGAALLSSVADDYARARQEDSRKRLECALSVALLLALALASAALLLSPLLVSAANLSAYRLAAILLALNIPLSLTSGLWLGLQKGHVAWGWDGVNTILLLAGLVCGASQHQDTEYFVAVSFGSILLGNTGSLMHLLVLHPELRPTRLTLAPRFVIPLLRQGLPFFLLAVTATLSLTADNIVAQSLLDAESASGMTILQRACQTVVGLLFVMTQPLWPAFIDALRKADFPWLKICVRRAFFVVVLVTSAGSAILICSGDILLRVWIGSAVQFPPVTLWAMAAWIMIQAFCLIPDMLLKAFGKLWLQIYVSLASALVALALKLLLAPRHGLAGILLGTVIAYGMIQLPLYWIWIWRRMSRVIFAGDTGLNEKHRSQ